ncbi:MAG TPA: ABC transporter permease, partial [Pseudobdellovibrionaceae bacterium]|nr:ABC transporter permease [Pseudobdellovibrionaceae bacterium]
MSLARAVLKRPQIVFLDDPLSAVDVETEQNLSERLLFGAWKDVTRVVATHRLEHLANFDRIFFMENGRVVAEGTLEEVKRASAR